MPNWVYNGLTAQGPKESVYKMKEQLNTPFVDYIESNGDLAFGIPVATPVASQPAPVFTVSTPINWPSVVDLTENGTAAK
jgi:hypothetical protein